MDKAMTALLCGLALGGVFYAGAQDSPEATDVGAYDLRSCQRTVLLRGSAQLAEGSCTVTLPESFLNQVVLDKGLDVIVTPTENCRGLYVSATSSTGFTVREAENGHCGAKFRWFVVACPK